MQHHPPSATDLVVNLLQMTMDPDIPGEDAIVAWRTEAAEHGDHQLVEAIDAHDYDELARLWDYGCGVTKC